MDKPRGCTGMLPECVVRVDGLHERLVLQISTLREIIETRLDAADHALGLQAREVERRLDGLNHEQARLAADRAFFVPRETFEGFARETRGWRDRVEQYMAEGQGRNKGLSVAWAVLIGMVPTLLALAALWQRAQP